MATHCTQLGGAKGQVSKHCTVVCYTIKRNFCTVVTNTPSFLNQLHNPSVLNVGDDVGTRDGGEFII